jgi:heptose I phosphotransferase
MMFEYRWIDVENRPLVARHRLDDLQAVLTRRDGQAIKPVHRGRDTIRLTLADAGGPRVVYIKREPAPRWKDLLRHKAAGRGFATLAWAEFELLLRLRAAGVGCPRPLVCIQQGLRPPRACLVLEGLPASTPLGCYLSGSLRDASRVERDSFFAVLGQQTARLHATGICHAELFANHVFVAEQDAGWNISFLDFQRSRCSRRLPLAWRQFDLAALWATLPRRLAGDYDRDAMLEAYLQAAELEIHGADLQAGVDRHMACLLSERRIWEIRESDTEEHRGVRSLESVDAPPGSQRVSSTIRVDARHRDPSRAGGAPSVPASSAGQMWVDRQFRPALDRRGLSSFEAMMTTTGGQLLRALPDRENWRLDLPAEGPRASGAYLKRHHVRSLRGWLRARLGAGPGVTPGQREARNVARLSRAGIAAMRLIAYGEKLHSSGLQESFVLTEELVGYTQLDHFLRQRFPPCGSAQWQRCDPCLERLIRDVAEVSSKFHRLGYNHRDLYCCHFFIQEPTPGRFRVNLIDLQRVEHRRRFRSRWVVKDLAQLAYSAPRDRITTTQRMAFIKHYLGVRRLRPQDKRLIRQVLAKQRLMERHLGAHP